jgi:hypothetical protein
MVLSFSQGVTLPFISLGLVCHDPDQRLRSGVQRTTRRRSRGSPTSDVSRWARWGWEPERDDSRSHEGVHKPEPAESPAEAGQWHPPFLQTPVRALTPAMQHTGSCATMGRNQGGQQKTGSQGHEHHACVRSLFLLHAEGVERDCAFLDANVVHHVPARGVGKDNGPGLFHRFHRLIAHQRSGVAPFPLASHHQNQRSRIRRVAHRQG